MYFFLFFCSFLLISGFSEVVYGYSSLRMRLWLLYKLSELPSTSPRRFLALRFGLFKTIYYPILVSIIYRSCICRYWPGEIASQVSWQDFEYEERDLNSNSGKTFEHLDNFPFCLSSDLRFTLDWFAIYKNMNTLSQINLGILVEHDWQNRKLPRCSNFLPLFEFRSPSSYWSKRARQRYDKKTWL